ncbi:hypothetical protein GW17_00007807 [Ensete ventricosum]|nr:hypothetical protein GW17_00007807 [Ensete ventricosum]
MGITSHIFSLNNNYYTVYLHTLNVFIFRLSAKAKDDEAVKHSLAVHSAVSSGNFILFFRLYKTAPNLNTFLMAIQMEDIQDTSIDGVEECEEWLRAHGAVLTVDNNGELQLDAKVSCASSTTLYMPEQEDAVAHGDASLAVDDFFTRTS